jgi:hypothetical protein
MRPFGEPSLSSLAALIARTLWATVFMVLDVSSAVATIAIDRTDKPRAYTTEVASRQSDRHPLLD